MSLSLSQMRYGEAPARRVRLARTLWPKLRRASGFLLLTGWVVLPLLPALGFLLSALLGLNLF